MAKTKLKKVTLWHLSRKHDMPMKELRSLLEDHKLIASWAKKVEKKPAKALIRAYQWVSKKSSWWLLSWFEKNPIGYVLLGSLAFMSLFGFLKNYADTMRTTFDYSGQEIVANQHSAADEAQGSEDHGSWMPDSLPNTWADI